MVQDGRVTDLALTTEPPAQISADVLIVAATTGATSGDGPTAIDPALADAVAAGALAGATGKASEVVLVPSGGIVAAQRILVVGLGAADKIDAEAVRRAAGAASRSLAGTGTAVSTLSAVDLAAAVEGHLLGAYVFDTYKEPSRPPVELVQLAVAAAADDAGQAGDETDPGKIVRRATIIAEAVKTARDLVNTAPNDLPPAVFADRALAAAEAVGLEVRVWNEQELRDQGFGGISAVGSGSTRPPRLVRVAWRPDGATKTVALVGKGITFDSGGLSIKPAQGMEHMTSDMAGAAAVIATVIAAARLELPIGVTAWAPLAENLPSGSSYRPGDVLRHYGGKTVHVLNTDAEGRLVLADAIVRAAEESPDYLVETSTLTGAQVVALGNRTIGVMGEPAFRDRVAEIARETGEGGWAMPLPEELREGLDSPIADIANINWDRVAGMLVAGVYLAEFVPEGLPWAHLDVAGPAFNHGKVWGYTALGATGVPVRTMLALLDELSNG